MKRTTLAVLMIALAILAMAAPMAYAQAPAPKVTINGLIDNVTSYSQNMANYNGGVFNRSDTMWYSRVRGRFDIIGEVGKAKGVLGLELDHVWGQAGSNDSTIVNAGSAATTAVQTGFGTDGSFDLNTDSRGIIEIKWLYVEFPVPLIPVPTTARLGAQPFGALANYKLATYATGDFPGVSVTSQITPNVKIVATYVQVEENLTGPNTRNGLASTPNFPSSQNRGDDWAGIIAPEITPFKGLDVKPMFSYFYASGVTNGNARAGRGGIGTGNASAGTNQGGFAAADGSPVGGINENRYTVGADARVRVGPWSFDPTVLYQFGNRGVIGPTNAAFQSAGVVAGRKYYANIDAWLVDLRGGFQLGPLLLEGLGVYSTGNKIRSTTLNSIGYFQPLTTDTSYLADWGTQLTSLGIDYLNAFNEAGTRMAYPGATIGWDKYGRGQVGFKATYAFTPALSLMAGVNGHWTAEAVDRNSTAVAGAGLQPSFTGGPRDNSNFVGTEFMTVVTWRFADGLAWDNSFGYMIPGKALDAVTDPAQGPRNTNTPWMITSRVRFTF
jgi:hypothetical protein